MATLARFLKAVATEPVALTTASIPKLCLSLLSQADLQPDPWFALY
jgi:hypothetical protein